MIVRLEERHYSVAPGRSVEVEKLMSDYWDQFGWDPKTGKPIERHEETWYTENFGEILYFSC